MFLVFICNLISCSAAVLLSLSIYMLLFSRKFLTREDSTGEDVAEWMKGIWPSHHDPTHKKIQGKNYWITMHAHDGQEEGGQEDDFHYSKERQEKHVCVVMLVNQWPPPVLLYVHSTYIVGRSHWFHWKAYSLVRFAIIQWVLDYWNDHVQKKFPDNRGIPLNDIFSGFLLWGSCFGQSLQKYCWMKKKEFRNELEFMNDYVNPVFVNV